MDTIPESRHCKKYLGLTSVWNFFIGISELVSLAAMILVSDFSFAAVGS